MGFGEINGMLWTALIWHRLGISGESSCEHGNEPHVYHTILIHSSADAKLAVFREGVTNKELYSYNSKM
jgi:hypothetical protein